VNELPRGDRDEPQVAKPDSAPPNGSWVPILIEYGPNAHVHGAIWWLWNRPWRTENLPRGVHLIDANTAKRGCELCERWISLHGWPKEVPKPEKDRVDTPNGLFDPPKDVEAEVQESEVAPEGVGERRDPENGRQTSADAPQNPKKDSGERKTSGFTDF